MLSQVYEDSLPILGYQVVILISELWCYFELTVMNEIVLVHLNAFARLTEEIGRICVIFPRSTSYVLSIVMLSPRCMDSFC